MSRKKRTRVTGGRGGLGTANVKRPSSPFAQTQMAPPTGDWRDRYRALRLAAANQGSAGTAATPPAATPAAAPADTAAPTGPYMDAEYLAWKAQDDAGRERERARLDSEESTDATARSEAIRRLLARRPGDLQQANVAANNVGLFYSGHLGQQRGAIEAEYVQRQAETHGEFDARKTARDAARRALEEGASLEEAAELARAADRGVERDQGWAQANALAAVGAPAPPAGTPAAPAIPPAAQGVATPPKPTSPGLTQKQALTPAQRQAQFRRQQQQQRQRAQQQLARQRARRRKSYAGAGVVNPTYRP